MTKNSDVERLEKILLICLHWTDLKNLLRKYFDTFVTINLEKAGNHWFLIYVDQIEINFVYSFAKPTQFFTILFY